MGVQPHDDPGNSVGEQFDEREQQGDHVRDGLRKRGFRFVTVSDLLALDKPGKIGS